MKNSKDRLPCDLYIDESGMKFNTRGRASATSKEGMIFGAVFLAAIILSA